MGYMGFGLQKWIYSQRARKPFSKSKRSSCDTISGYSVPELKISGQITRNLLIIDDEINRRKGKIKKRKTTDSIFNLVLGCLVIIFIIFITKNLLEPDIHKDAFSERNILNTNTANFNLAINYGKNYLENGDYDLAINEFKSALRIKPDNVSARELLAKTYYTTCLKYGKYCKEAIWHYSLLIQNDSSITYFKSRAEIYIHLKDYNLAEYDNIFIEKKVNRKQATMEKK